MLLESLQMHMPLFRAQPIRQESSFHIRAFLPQHHGFTMAHPLECGRYFIFVRCNALTLVTSCHTFNHSMLYNHFCLYFSLFLLPKIIRIYFMGITFLAVVSTKQSSNRTNQNIKIKISRISLTRKHFIHQCDCFYVFIAHNREQKNALNCNIFSIHKRY